MTLTETEVAALRCAAASGPLRRLRPHAAPRTSAYGVDPAGEHFGARTVFALERLGFVAMPDTTCARITDAGCEALRAVPAPRGRGRPRSRRNAA